VHRIYAHRLEQTHRFKITVTTARPARDNGIDKRAADFIAGAALRAAPATAPAQDNEAGKAVVNMRFDAQLLARVDAAAKQQGISRTAWLHVAASKALDR
jgi:hypothetical protein